MHNNCQLQSGLAGCEPVAMQCLNNEQQMHEKEEELRRAGTQWWLGAGSEDVILSGS